MTWGEPVSREPRGRTDRHPCRCYCGCPGVVPVPNVRGDAGDCYMCGLGLHQGIRMERPPERWRYAVTESEGKECYRLALASTRDRGVSGVRERGMTRLERNHGAYMGEVATARLLGYPDWMPVRVRRKFADPGDGPHGHGVRWTDDLGNRLILYESDARGRIMISTRGPIEERVMQAVGWFVVAHGIIDDWEDPRFSRDVTRGGRIVSIRAFMVPNLKLHPMDRLGDAEYLAAVNAADFAVRRTR